MRDNTLTQQKIRDFCKIYFSIIADKQKNKHFYIQTKVLKEVCKFPAPRFYISFEQASRYISKKRQGKQKALQNTLIQQQYDDFYNTYLTLYEHYCNTKSNSDIIIMAINSPAPQFYITYRSGLDFISRYWKIWNK